MKKLILLFTVIVLLISGCFHKKEEVYMDKPAEDGKYHYQNKDLGFSVVLPQEFMYYQTQRKKTKEYTDIEFFVPTTTKYKHEVPGYGKSMIVRVFKKQVWEKINKEDEMSLYNEMGEKDGAIYTIKFWELAPKDWGGKWTINMEKEIVDSFKIIQ